MKNIYIICVFLTLSTSLCAGTTSQFIDTKLKEESSNSIKEIRDFLREDPKRVNKLSAKTIANLLDHSYLQATAEKAIYSSLSITANLRLQKSVELEDHKGKLKEKMKDYSFYSLKMTYGQKKNKAFHKDILEEVSSRDLSKVKTNELDIFVVSKKSNDPEFKKLFTDVRSKTIQALSKRSGEMGVYSRSVILREDLSKKNAQESLATFKKNLDSFKRGSTSRNKFIQKDLNNSLKELIKVLNTLPSSELSAETFKIIKDLIEKASNKGIYKERTAELKLLSEKNSSFSINGIANSLKKFANFGTAPKDNSCQTNQRTVPHLSKDDFTNISWEQSQTNCSLMNGADKASSVRKFRIKEKGAEYDCQGRFQCRLPEGAMLRVAGGYKWILDEILSCTKRGPRIR